jgi:hypothetical protein
MFLIEKSKPCGGCAATGAAQRTMTAETIEAGAARTQRNEFWDTIGMLGVS